MDSQTPNTNQAPQAAPAPVVLQPRTDNDGAQPAPDQTAKKPIRLGRRSFRPSHRATFIALVVIIVLIAANAGVVIVVIQRQAKTASQNKLAGVSINQDVLDQLGVSRSPIGTSSEALVVTPNSVFNGTLTVNKDVKLSTKLSAGETNLAQLAAGNTSLTQLNVAGNSTLGDTSLRSNLNVAGISNFQGNVTITKLLTAAGANITGNLSVGGSFSTNNFSARSLTSTSTLTIGGHIITAGSVPGIAGGGAPGPAGTVSMSGNDSAGTVVMNTGQSPSAGIIASINFRSAYGSTPHVVITPVGGNGAPLSYYVNRSATGFSIGTYNTPSTGTTYVFDYIVMQ